VKFVPGQPVSREFEITQADFGTLAAQPNLRELPRLAAL
jgi:hypothetical protein